jgi:hypothetical protein
MGTLRSARFTLIAAFTIAALSTAAVAQQAPAPHPSPTALLSPWVGTKSAPVANPNPHRTGLFVSNSSPVTLWVSPTGAPAAVNGAGSVPIQPLQGRDVRTSGHAGLDSGHERGCAPGRAERHHRP